MIKRNILCIDLKSFFAFVECIDRNLDPFTTPLVVANKTQGNGAITLAITPYLKNLGIKSRTRLYEIPKNIKYFIATPRMARYIVKSKEVISIYLDFINEDDLHVYSIDEAFLDLTNYLKMYNKNEEEIAQDILNKIKEKTGLCATCGIGPNLLIAKLAMDLEAKKNKNGIARWNYQDIKTKLWPISPLSTMWGIGNKMEKRLNNLGIYTIGDLANYDKNKLIKKYGVIGEELWNNANGFDESIICKQDNIFKDKSYSIGQILFKDYDESNISLIIEEMVDSITARLRKNNKECKKIGLKIGYSKNIGGGFYHQVQLDNTTDNKEIILKYCLLLFNKYYEFLPIRKISISLGKLIKKEYIQLNIFDTYQEIKLENQYNVCTDYIKDKYGKNCLLFASSLLSDSTIKDRNNKIGGHHA